MANNNTHNNFLKAQVSEITEHKIYSLLAARFSGHNRSLLQKIADDELRHYNFWKQLTKKDVIPNKAKIWFVLLISKIFGVLFAVKLMEWGEDYAVRNYSLLRNVEGIESLIKDETAHEQHLISLLNDSRLEYAGSVVLGLNDALVELTGALAGMTLALLNTKLIAIAGLVTGVAASLSMTASSYLESKHNNKSGALKFSMATGLSYIVTVIVLVLPFFIITSKFLALGATISLGLVIIALFNFYISVVKGESFVKEFITMAIISLGVAVISFVVALFLRDFVGV